MEQKNNELFCIRPNLHQYYGRTVTKDMKFDETTENGKVHQVLDNLVLTTTLHSESVYENVEQVEDSTLVQKLPENTVLIWDEVNGYVVTYDKMCKLKDIEEDIKNIKDIYKDNTDINPVE